MFGLGPAEISVIGFIIFVVAVAVLVIPLVLSKIILKSNKSNNMEAVLSELREIKAEIAEIKHN